MDSRFRDEIMDLWFTLRKALQDTANRPNGMLGDERLEIRGRPLERWQIRAVPHVAQRDTNVPKKTTALDAFNRRTAEKRTELLIIEREIVPQGPLGSWFRFKGGFSRNRGEPIPRARLETIVAAINPVTNKASQFRRD